MSNKTFYNTYKNNIDILIKKYPQLFNKEFPAPLSLGIHKAIRKETGMSAIKLNRIMTIWTSRLEYTLMCLSMPCREDLKGGLVLMSTEHLDHYISKLHSMMDNKRHLGRVKKFAIEFNKEMCRPAFLCIPMKSRPDLGCFK